MSKVLVLYAPKPSILSFLPELEKILLRRGIEYYDCSIDPHLESFKTQKLDILNHLTNSSFIICLGGDGTVLAAASVVHPFDIPILPVNFGQLGFIAEETHAQNLEEMIIEIQDGSILEEKRTLLESWVSSNNSSIYTALNEVYIGSNNLHRVATFNIWVDNQELSQHKADGILVSTATGSTGYNLSAGGPIVHPSLDVLVVNSVVPHRITHRPLILPSHITITASICNEFSQNLIIDGQHKTPIHPGEILTIRKSPHTLTLLYSAKRNYFHSLKKKLHWMT